MDFIDEMKSVASDLGKTVGRYAANAYEASKQKVTVLDLKTKLNEAYKQLGKLCYKNSVGEEELTEKIAEKTEEITALIEKIKEYDN